MHCDQPNQAGPSFVGDVAEDRSMACFHLGHAGLLARTRMVGKHHVLFNFFPKVLLFSEVGDKAELELFIS